MQFLPGPGVSSPSTFLFMPRGVNDTAGLQAAVDRAAAYAAVGNRRAEVRIRGDASATCRLPSPVHLDGDRVTISSDPGVIVSSARAAFVIGHHRRAYANGSLSHGRHRVPLAGLVSDPSVGQSRYAIRTHDPSVEVVGTPPGNATLTLTIKVGNTTGTTAAFPATATAAQVAAAMQATIQAMGGNCATTTVACTGGPLGAAPVAYALGGTLAGLVPTVTCPGPNRSNFGQGTYVNCGQAVHASFDSTPWTHFWADEPNANIKVRNWSDVKVLTLAISAWSADWTRVGIQKDGSFVAVGLAGADEGGGRPVPYEFTYQNYGATGRLSVNYSVAAADPYAAGTVYRVQVTSTDRSQQLQKLVVRLDLESGAYTAWLWDAATDTYADATASVSNPAPPAGSRLRRNLMCHFSAGASGRSATKPFEWLPPFGDGAICGLHVAASDRFATDGSGKMVIKGGTTRPNHSQVFFATDLDTLGSLALTDGPGSLDVAAVGLGYTHAGMLVNESLQPFDCTDAPRLSHLEIASDSKYGPVLSVWLPNGLRVDGGTIAGGAWSFCEWDATTHYPTVLAGVELSQPTQGGVKAINSNLITIRDCKFQYPNRFSIVCRESCLRVDNMFVAPSGLQANEAIVWAKSSSSGANFHTLTHVAADFEGYYPNRAAFVFEPNTAHSLAVSLVNVGIGKIGPTSPGVWVPAVANSKPSTLSVDTMVFDGAVSDGGVVVQVDDPNCSGSVRGISSPSQRYVAGAGNVVAHLYAASPPTVGAFDRGRAIVWNTNPAANGVACWLCTASGDNAATPPSWSAMPLGPESSTPSPS